MQNESLPRSTIFLKISGLFIIYLKNTILNAKVMGSNPCQKDFLDVGSGWECRPVQDIT